MPLQHAGLAALYGDDFRKDPAQFDPDVARQIERGLSLPGLRWLGPRASAAIRAAFAEFLCEFDLLLTPTVPCVAWPLMQLGPTMIDGKEVSPRAHAAFTPFVNHARLPAISIPCGRDASGLPFGFRSSREGDETGCCCVRRCALRMRYVRFEHANSLPSQ